MVQKNSFNQYVGDSIENWMPRKRPSGTSMRGNYCILEPLKPNEHALKLFESFQYDDRGELWTYLFHGPFDTYRAFHDWLEACALDNNDLYFTILDIKTNEPVGITAYLRINPEHGVIEIGDNHYSKRLQKTPAATEVMYLMMYRVFEEFKYRRYEWKCDSLNQASRMSAQRLGFKFEGIFRQDKVYKNRNRDTAWYSIIDKEWPEIKDRLQRWLDPSNFDADGNQIVKLKEI